MREASFYIWNIVGRTNREYHNARYLDYTGWNMHSRIASKVAYIQAVAGILDIRWGTDYAIHCIDSFSLLLLQHPAHVRIFSVDHRA